MHPSLRDWLAEAPFALGMSSGFFGFFAHTGVLTALDEAGLKPCAASGSSAGALVTGLWASGLEPEAMTEQLFRLEKADFWDPAPGLGLLRGRRFRQLLEDMLQVQTFEECRVPLALSVHDVMRHATRVMNTGPLAPAIHASCCVPLMFHPVWIGRRPHLDGGLSDRPGLAGLQDQPRVLYHHLASRSPWRRRRGAQTRIPERAGLQTVVIEGLSRASPDRLEHGRRAWREGRDGMRRALDAPITDAVLRIDAPDIP